MVIHEMIRSETDEAGRDRLECIYCPRVVIATWPGDELEFDRTIVVRGDESVAHSATRGAISVRAMTIS